MSGQQDVRRERLLERLAEFRSGGGCSSSPAGNSRNSTFVFNGSRFPYLVKQTDQKTVQNTQKKNPWECFFFQISDTISSLFDTVYILSGNPGGNRRESMTAALSAELGMLQSMLLQSLKGADVS